MKHGVYRHFEGRVCRTIGMAARPNKPDDLAVLYIYVSDPEHWIWYLPLREFEGRIETETYSGPRFTLIYEDPYVQGRVDASDEPHQHDGNPCTGCLRNEVARLRHRLLELTGRAAPEGVEEGGQEA